MQNTIAIRNLRKTLLITSLRGARLTFDDIRMAPSREPEMAEKMPWRARLKVDGSQIKYLKLYADSLNFIHFARNYHPCAVRFECVPIRGKHMRILIAGILGAVAMFAWTSIAHIATPLGNTGISQIPDETSVIGDMQKTIGTTSGLYIFPWIDPKDPKMMEKYAAKVPNSPTGLLLYHPPGSSPNMTKPMILEFVKELVESLIAAFLLGWAAIAGFAARTGFVTLIGVGAAASTNASYWIWYGFPGDYTLAQIVIPLIGYVVAGIVIALTLPKPAH